MKTMFVFIGGPIVLFVIVLLVGRSLSNGGEQSATAQGPSIDLGKSLYRDRCTMCHGEDGKGNGYAAPIVHPRPRDFTRGLFKFRTTESGSIPTDADLERTVTLGLHGTAMPDWGSFLKGDSLKAVIAYIKSFSPRFVNEQPRPVKIGAVIPTSAASIEAGKKVFEKLQCASCHGSDGTGKDATASDFSDDLGNEIFAANLTEPWTFRGGATTTDIYHRFRTGIDGSPMPSYIGSATDREMWDLSNYIVSLAQKPIWEITASEVSQRYEALQQKSKADPITYGKQLVRVYGCITCHSAYDEKGFMIDRKSVV